jgi:hypothetical protein
MVRYCGVRARELTTWRRRKMPADDKATWDKLAWALFTLEERFGPQATPPGLDEAVRTPALTLSPRTGGG